MVLLLTLAVLVTGQIYRFRLALVGLLATLTALWCDAAATFYYGKPRLLCSDDLVPHTWSVLPW